MFACGRDHFDPAHNYAFVTSTVHAPTTFGGELSGADAICAAAAGEAQLLGTYVAYLGSSTVRAPDRLGNARGWVRLDGAPVVDRVDDLTAGRLLHPIRVDELGEDVGDAAGPVATGADSSGNTEDACTDWSSAGGGYTWGYSAATTDFWTSTGFPDNCTTAVRLYCFGIAYDAALEITPVQGRRAFVSVQAFVPGGGLAAADALCASEASLAGLSGTFRALLGSSTSTAASRFDLSGRTWVRVDGIALADTPLDFMAGNLTAPPNVTAVGTYTSGTVMTGGSPGLVSSTCSDWTDSGVGPGGVGAGLSEFAAPSAFDLAAPIGCAGAPIYCLEQ